MFDKKYQDFPTNHFDISDNIFVFRDGSGNIAVENPNKITIRCTPEDKVTLITLSNEKKSVSFWKVATNLTTTFYALTSSQPYTFPACVDFVDLYTSASYPQGLYIKYVCSGYYGILYVSQTELSCVISHTDNYSDIYFEDGTFYATKSLPSKKDSEASQIEASATEKAIYYILDEAGKIISEHDTEVKKVKGFQLYYDDKRILNAAFSQEIPGGIISIEVVNLKQSSVYTPKKFTFIKITTKKGILYYTTSLELLFGPICEDKINIEPDGLFISEVVDGKITKVFFVGDDEISGPFVKMLFSADGIEIYSRFRNPSLNYRQTNDIRNTFFKTKSKLFGYSHESNSFIKIFEDIDVSTYYLQSNAPERFSSDDTLGQNTILGCKNGVPVCFAVYTYKSLTIKHSDLLNVVASGYSDDKCKQYICKGKNSGQIIVVEEKNNDKKILFYTGIPVYGCSLKTRFSSRYLSKQPVYLIDIDKDVFGYLDTRGLTVT